MNGHDGGVQEYQNICDSACRSEIYANSKLFVCYKIALKEKNFYFRRSIDESNNKIVERKYSLQTTNTNSMIKKFLCFIFLFFIVK